MRNRSLFVVLTLALSFRAEALEPKIFKTSDAMPKTLDLYAEKSSKNLKNLSQIKWFELNGQDHKCVEKVEQEVKNESLGVWLPHQHLVCLKKAYSSPSNWKVSRFLNSFKKFEVNKSILLQSPYPNHQDLLLNVFLDLAEKASESARNDFDAFIDRNQDLVDHMDEGQRARYYKVMGEMAWLRQKNELAVSNFLRSYQFSPDSKVLERLKTLKADQILKIDKYSVSFSETEEEKKLWGKFSIASQKGQTYKVAQYGVEFLNSFPGSERVGEVQERVNTLFKRLLYRRGQKYVSIKNDFETQLMKAPPQHILHWATEAYERGYHDSSYRLAEKAADKWEDTPQAAKALIIAARSAYYLVKRSAAESHLNELIEKYSGHEESHEAHYLLGLLYYREGEYKNVIGLYDPFLMSPGSDKWELQVRYWLWRSLKKIQSTRASEIAESIFKTFPLTYYGLIVRMEEKKDLQSLLADVKTKEASYSLWWPKNTDRRWKRIQKLLELGWVDEAETEIDFMPDPKTADGFAVRARLWEAALKSNRAIGDRAAAVDLDLDYINPTFMQESFPKKHEDFVLAAEKEFSISRNLIWAIMRQESAFMARAVSTSYAYGLMQLLAGTGKETAKWLRVKNFRVPTDLFDPKKNIRFGTHFISRMYRKYKGVTPLAVASYNVGPGNLDRWLSHRSDLTNWDQIGQSLDDDIWVDELPWAETSFYVKAVMRNYLLYKLIHEKYDQLSSPPWKESQSQD
jgi:soluble lytic murein transglycosylase